MPRTEPARSWWQNAVVYQVYPRSFQDTNGDGIGDLNGVRARLDYLDWLGIDAIWLSPFYPSPMADLGYDVSDFCNVDPVYGTLADFDRLLGEAHARGIKVILDYVPNHTSDQHPWFADSRSSRDDPKRNWYVWQDPRPDASAPNNWSSRFGGSAWEWDQGSRQFYYHAFLKEQPDLNWRNPEVQRAMADVLRFWMKRGADGIRVDAVANLIEDDLLRNDPPHPDCRGEALDRERLRYVFTKDRPETHGCVAHMRAVLDEFDDRVMIGEAHLPIARIMAYYGGKRPGFHLPFNFILLHTPWDARSIEAAIDQYTILLPEDSWPNWVLGNHDEPRVASRVGEQQARVAAMLLMTLEGTPFIYYGDELGLRDARIPVHLVRDRSASDLHHIRGRDPQRTPMPWDDGRHGGFSDAEPWLPLGGDCHRNVSSSPLTLIMMPAGSRATSTYARTRASSFSWDPNRDRKVEEEALIVL